MPEEVPQENQASTSAEASQNKATHVTIPETDQEKYKRSLKKRGLASQLV